MRRNGWHIIQEDGVLTLARRQPVHFDVSATTHLPIVRKLPLAHQIRQDLWRGLQHLRGFCPIVRIAERDGALWVTAGGQVNGRFSPAVTNAKIADVLSCQKRRDRWVRWAA